MGSPGFQLALCTGLPSTGSELLEGARPQKMHITGCAWQSGSLQRGLQAYLACWSAVHGGHMEINCLEASWAGWAHNPAARHYMVTVCLRHPCLWLWTHTAPLPGTHSFMLRTGRAYLAPHSRSI